MGPELPVALFVGGDDVAVLHVHVDERLHDDLFLRERRGRSLAKRR